MIFPTIGLFNNYNEMMKEKRDKVLRRSIPLPKKVVAAIKNVPSGARGNQLPSEFVRVLNKTIHDIGSNVATDLTQILAPLKTRFADEVHGASMAEEFEQAGNMLEVVTRDNPTFSATVPVILKRSGGQKPELIGSGVLIRIVNRTFLLTAAHVTDRQDEGTLLIPGRQNFIQLTGWFSYMRLPASGRRDDDKLDVAYFRLDNDCANYLHSSCTILERQDVSLEAKPAMHTIYTFAGYPWRKSKVKGVAIETDFTTMSGIEAKDSEYEALGLKRARHIAIRFHRKRTFSSRLGRVVVSPLPHGMSGGGVYAWSKEAIKSLPVRLPLVGITNEFVAKQSLLIATRLHVYVRCIFHNQPDLAAIATGYGSKHPE